MKRYILVGALLCATACTSSSEPLSAAATEAPSSEPLYFALEVKRAGRVVARPKLLGETARTVRAERRPSGAQASDYHLVLFTRPEGDGYRLSLGVALPDARGEGELFIRHGEVRTIELGTRPGELQVQVTLMRVDSPEFRTLMRLTEEASQRRTLSI